MKTVTNNRDVKPGDAPKGYVSGYFIGLSGLNTTDGTNDSDYQDFLILNMYTDTTGGLVNALAFDKSEKKIRHYTANQGDTVWGTPEIIAYQSYVDTAKAAAIAASAPSTHVSVVATTAVLGHVKIGDGISVDANGVISITAGDGVSLVGTTPNKSLTANVDGTSIILVGSAGNKQIAHADTSTQASVTNTNATVIQSIGLDGMGHVTSLSSKTLTAADVSAVPTSDVVTVATANKILKLDGNGKLPASITGDANTLDGINSTQFVRNDVANENIQLKVGKGTFSDPDSANTYAIKASGGISTDVVNIGGKINLQYNATENSLDIVFI